MLLSPFPAFDASGSKRLHVPRSGSSISIPTFFVQGECDPLAQIVALTKGLVNKKSLVFHSWKGGHEIPNSSEQVMWVEIVTDLIKSLRMAYYWRIYLKPIHSANFMNNWFCFNRLI